MCDLINVHSNLRACRMRYTVTLQAVLAAGDQVQQVVLAGSILNDTGERPIIAYLFGVEAIGVANQSALGVVSLPLWYLSASFPWTELGLPHALSSTSRQVISKQMIFDHVRVCRDMSVAFDCLQEHTSSGAPDIWDLCACASAPPFCSATAVVSHLSLERACHRTDPGLV